MEQHKYISVAEFSERVGLSRTAVNNYTNNDGKLVKFTKVVDGRKVISEAALELFVSNSPSKDVYSGIDSGFTPEERYNSLLESELERVNRKLDFTAKMLQDEQSKNTALQEQILNLQEHILKLSNDYSELAKQSNVLVSQAQTIMLLNAPKPAPAPEPETQPEPKRKGLFGLFRKK